MEHFKRQFVNSLHDQSAKRRLLLYFLIVLIFFGSFSKPDFATDTYAYAVGDFAGIVDNFLRCGRIFTAGLYTILRLLGVNILFVNFGCFLLAVISLTFALYILEKLLRQNFVKSNLWSFLLPLIILINPFIIDFFLFIEKGIMCFTIFLCVLSVYYYNKFLDSRRRQDLFKVLFLNIFATFWYQGIIGLFIVLATMVTILKSKQWRSFIRDTALSVGLYLVGPVVNIIVIKLISSNGRASGGFDIFAAAKVVMDSLNEMFSAFGIIPVCIFWGYLCLILICWLYFLIRRHNKSIPFYFAAILYLAAVVLLASIVPQLALQPDAVWLAPRAVYPFATLTGVILVLIVSFTPEFFKNQALQIITIVATACFGAVELFNFNTIILDHYSLAEIDRLRAENIGQIINQYEQETGIEIKNIAPSPDEHTIDSYPGIKLVRDSNVTAFSKDWSDIANINFWNGRNFHRIKPSAEWQEYCASHNWQNLDENQFKFNGDTLQICLY